MLRWALGFYVAAAVAALIGFGGIGGAAAVVARAVYWLAVALFVVASIGLMAREARP